MRQLAAKLAATMVFVLLGHTTIMVAMDITDTTDTTDIMNITITMVCLHIPTRNHIPTRDSMKVGWRSMKVGKVNPCGAGVIFVGWGMIVLVTIVCSYYLLLVPSAPLLSLLVAHVASAPDGRCHHQWNRACKILCIRHQ